ncbi:hypothetical protein CK203_089266 [Vitis vinifera]|uniref:Uncharacterized protein n=1 Tax=Vitis vinifera TaxID=29760 RepID=A0A438BSY2_VITVI|nr:hypothetical protein CK203_089266 [Vitis vinifera]
MTFLSLFADNAGEALWDAAHCTEPNGRRPGVPGEVKEADAEKRRALLDDREKRKNDGTLRKAPGQKRSATSLQGKPQRKRGAEVIIEEPVNPAPNSISSGPEHVAGLNHSGPSVSVVACLATLAEEAASINHPGSPIRMLMQLRPFARKRR